MQIKKFILILSCKDRPGLIVRITSLLTLFDGNVLELSQFISRDTQETELPEYSINMFFMRCVFECPTSAWDPDKFHRSFSSLAQELGDEIKLRWTLYPADKKPRTLILVSKEAHCLNDLLHRVEHAQFPIETIGIISNHDKLQSMATWHQIPFFHYPVTTETKQAQEEKIAKFIETEQIELVILARYMQILSPWLTEKIAGKAINIHHSFLPSFKGAKPYHQAFARGVKLIGATAHFVSDELDEGPIIEQEVVRVGHALSPEELVLLGKDIECLVLSRAIRHFAERRIFLHQKKTIILQ